MNSTPDTLRAKWAVGIDEDNPQYAFIGVEGASICWVENDDADAFRKIVDAHNATLDALEAAEKWAQAEWHRANMLAGWAAGNVSNAGCDEASREAGMARDGYAALAAGESGK